MEMIILLIQAGLFKGFKLINSSTLPDSTTFVTNNPVYIQGDFNKHTSTDPDQDTWKPCAVVSDAITLLSNSWNDSISNWKYSTVNPGTQMPVASSTQFNTVLITGNVPTKVGQYSGGLETFRDFLKTGAEKQSIFQAVLYNCSEANLQQDLWNGNYYSPPTRDWKAEDRFSNLNDLPPGFADLFPSAASVFLIRTGNK